jgi:DNA-binding helix-hairpin-helix protein with protein kinase domain
MVAAHRFADVLSTEAVVEPALLVLDGQVGAVADDDAPWPWRSEHVIVHALLVQAFQRQQGVLFQPAAAPFLDTLDALDLTLG